jgi:RNA polymerase primary sigma factor
MNSHDSATIPLRSAGKIAPNRGGLSFDQERELASRIAQGDRDARNLMVQANLGLVGKIAHKFRGCGMDYEDLKAEGNLGLIRGAEEFDPRFGTRFSSYAVYWIKQALLHALVNTTSTIRVPANIFWRLAAWRRAEQAFCHQEGRAPTFDEVAILLELTEVQKSLMNHALITRRLRLESSYRNETGEPLLECVEDTHDQIDTAWDAEDAATISWKLMECLDERERSVVVLRFGLQGVIMTRTEIACRMGMTIGSVRRIEHNAIRRLGGRRRRYARWTDSPDLTSENPRKSVASPPVDATLKTKPRIVFSDEYEKHNNTPRPHPDQPRKPP